MSREIKFRAWDKDTEKMYPMNCIDFNNFGTKAGVDHDESFELMQYTGLKDKNGNPIYEDDVIAVESYGKTTNYIMKFAELCYEGGYVHMGFELFYLESDEQVEYHGGFQDEYTIIGNKYENPELLKSESKADKNLV